MIGLLAYSCLRQNGYLLVRYETRSKIAVVVNLSLIAEVITYIYINPNYSLDMHLFCKNLLLKFQKTLIYQLMIWPV